MAGNGSLIPNACLQRNNQASRNETMHNSHIHGRKVDSPKIYVKEVNERPKTSAQQVRKVTQAATISNSSVFKKNKNTHKDRYPESKKINQNFLHIAPHTNKNMELQKFDFKFLQTAKAESGYREKSKKSVGKKKKNLNQSQVINLCSEKAGHHRAQTIHTGFTSTNNEVINLKMSTSCQRNSGSDHAQLPNSLYNSQDPHLPNKQSTWGTNEQQRGKNPCKSQNSNSNTQQRKKYQSVNLPKSSTNVDAANQIQDQQVINIQLPQSQKLTTSQPKKQTFATNGQKAIPTKPPSGFHENFAKVIKKGQNAHNQTVIIQKNSEYSSEVPKVPKTQRSQPGHYPNISSTSVVTGQERKKTKSGDWQLINNIEVEAKSMTKLGKTGNVISKTSRSKKDSSHQVHNSHTGLHDLKHAQNQKNNAHFRFDIVTNKENVQGNSSQNIIDKDQTNYQRSQLTISSDQSVSASNRKSTVNKSVNVGNFGKLLKNNFFVDGEQLLRHMSPGTPDKMESIKQSTDHIKVSHHSGKECSNSKSRGRTSTRQTSGNRPQAKALSGLNKHIIENSNKNTLEYDQLHAYQKNKIKMLSDNDDSFSGRQKESKPKKEFLSQQISATEKRQHDAQSSGGGSRKGYGEVQKIRHKEAQVNKIVKNNLRKRQKINTEELIKKFMEETQKKQKKVQITNLNHEVRKMNAMNVKATNLNDNERLQELLNKMKYKKKRSKSCINKSENIFQKGISGTKEIDNKDKKGKRDKSNENNKTSVLSGMLDPLLSKKNQEVAGRNNAVIELSQLKKEIDNEIRRDRKEGKLELLSPCANLSLSKKITVSKGSKVNKDLHYPKESTKNYTSLRITEPEVLFERLNREVESNIKIKIRQDDNEKYFASSGHVHSVVNALNTSKIQKFIEKQKRRNAARKNLEWTQQQEKAMKVHQNLTNLHNFTQKDRIKKQSKEHSFFNIKKSSNKTQHQQSQLLEHLRNNPIQNLKVGKKRNTSLEDDSIIKETNNTSKHREKHQSKKIKINALRQNRGVVKNTHGTKEIDNDTDLLEQTIVIDSSRMEEENSIINIYRKLSGSRKSSNSNAKSAFRSESGERISPQRRSISGVDHPPLKVLRPAKVSSPGQRQQTQPQTSGSDVLRKKHQQQLDQLDKKAKFLSKASPEPINFQNQAKPGLQNLTTISPNNKKFDSIEPVSQQKLTSEQFESIEPTRTAKQIKKSTEAKISSVHSQVSSQSFDRKIQELSNKYGRIGERETQLLLRLHTAAIKIQYHCRKYRSNRQKQKTMPPQKNLEVLDLDIRKQTSSDREFNKASSRDGTGQSIRKSLIPTLDLDKLGREQKNRAQVNQEQQYLVNPIIRLDQKEENEPPISTSRSIFARNTFREFFNDMGVKSLEELNKKNIPEMLKIREQAIQHRHNNEEKKIKNMFKKKQISPRTYDRKKKELEVWVTIEHDEVKKTKKIFEDDHQKTAKIINYSAMNSEHLKRILNGGQINGLIHHHNISKSSQNVQQTLTDRASSARVGGGSRRGEGRSQLLAMIYENGKVQNTDIEVRNRLGSFEENYKKSSEDLLAVSDDESVKKNIPNLEPLKEKSPVIQVEQTDESPTNEHDDPFSKIIVLNPNTFKTFPQTAQKPTIKEQLAKSGKKSSIKTSDNPESLRDLMSSEQELQRFGKPSSPNNRTNTDRSLDIDGVVDRELEEQFNKHINQHLLGRLIQEERDNSGYSQSNQESSGKPSKKNGDLAPTGPFKQRRQAFEAVNSQEKPLHRVTSQQQLQENHELDLSSCDEKLKKSDTISEEKTGNQASIFGKARKQHLIQIPEDEDELARKVMEVSPVSNSNSQIAFSKDDLKNSIRSDTFFMNNLNKINSGQATSFDDLQQFTDVQKDIVAHLQGAESYEMTGLQSHTITTPLSEGNNDKIRIEISGKQLNNVNDGFQPAISFQIGSYGAPVSPMSTDSMGGIKCGATSLSSNTSDEKAMPLPGLLRSIPEMSEENKSRLNDSNYLRSNCQELQETNQTLHLSVLDTTGNLDSANKYTAISQLSSIESSNKKAIPEDQLGKQLSKELRDHGEKLADEIFQLLLVELSIDLPLMTNRNIQRANESGQHFKDQAHGIKTDLFAIERYVDEVQNEVMGNVKDFMAQLSKPLTKDSINTLNLLQNSEIGSCEHFEENFPQILHLDLYLTLEKRRKEKREKQIQEMEEADSDRPKTQSQIHNSILRTFLAECEHIHNKVLFDCINDSLLQFKPYSKEGQPLPWSRQNRRLKPSEEFTINEIFEIVKHDLFRCAVIQSGTLPRKEMVFQGVFDQDLFDEIREKKLVHMLCCEMIENEPKWLNYEFEHAQVKIDVGDMILETLVNEAIALLNENSNRDLQEVERTASLIENSKSNNIEDSWPSVN